MAQRLKQKQSPSNKFKNEWGYLSENLNNQNFSNRKITTCKSCGTKIAKTAKRCPKCGAKQHIAALAVVWLLVFFITIIVIYAIISGIGNKENRVQAAGKTFSEMNTKSSSQSPTTVLMNKNGVKITYTGIKLTQYLENQSNGYMLSVGLKIENTSSMDITVYPINSSVNGVMKTAISGLPLTILSGKKAINAISFANLEGTGIDSVKDTNKVKDVEFRLSVCNSSNSSEVFKSDVITIKP